VEGLPEQQEADERGGRVGGYQDRDLDCLWGTGCRDLEHGERRRGDRECRAER
jgi:hypothetical protein